MQNIIDKWYLSLVASEALGGWGIVIYVLLALSISAILSFLIGLERYRKGENAGMRTHALLAVGCAFLMTISLFALEFFELGENEKYDISRIAAGTITGIGFLGAGVIIKDKFTVKGLSTATTLWICAAVGMATGAGFLLEAIIATAITMLIVWIRNRIIIGVDKNAPHVIIETAPNFAIIEAINDVCNRSDINLKNIQITSLNEKHTICNAYFPYQINPLLLEYFCVELKKIPEVTETKIIMKKNAVFENPHES